jgi:hypothetical protein
MTYQELRAKFDDNASEFLSADASDTVADAIQHLEALPDAGVLLLLAT